MRVQFIFYLCIDNVSSAQDDVCVTLGYSADRLLPPPLIRGEIPPSPRTPSLTQETVT